MKNMPRLCYPGSRVHPPGDKAGECGICFTFLDRFCRGINIIVPSVMLASLSLGRQPSCKQIKGSHSSVKTFHISIFLDESSRLNSHKANVELNS